MQNNLLLLFVSTVGFINALFLYWQYRQFELKGRKMYCILGENCSLVVGSKYGKTLGFKNEIIGMIFYSFLIIVSLFSFFPSAIISQVKLIILLAVSFSAIFSCRLLYLQLLILKTKCSWCLIAILINLLIFFLVTGNLFF